MMRVLVSLYAWTIAVLATLLAYIVLFLFSIFFAKLDPFAKKRHLVAIYWARCIGYLNPFWEFDISGLENVDRSKTYVLVGNHSSMADIIVVLILGLQFKWVVKEGLFKIPVFGRTMRFVKYMSLEREDFSSIRKVNKQMVSWLRNGVSIFLFPEGTRSIDGRLGAFKNGAFKLAISEKKPILPIVLSGTYDILPKGSWILTGRRKVQVKILSPIDTTSYDIKDFAKLRDLTREKFKLALGQ